MLNFIFKYNFQALVSSSLVFSTSNILHVNSGISNYLTTSFANTMERHKAMYEEYDEQSNWSSYLNRKGRNSFNPTDTTNSDVSPF